MRVSGGLAVVFCPLLATLFVQVEGAMQDIPPLLRPASHPVLRHQPRDIAALAAPGAAPASASPVAAVAAVTKAKWPTGSPDAGKNWTMATNFQTLKSFKITEFTPGGEQNCQVLTGGLPSSATQNTVPPQSSTPGGLVSTVSSVVGALGSSLTSLVRRAKTAPSVIQVDYPAGSSNPGGTPVGGCQFYASTPLALTSARSVRLRYSVYFPKGWNWVMGGKLPGLYGGRTGCSGGDAATDCWSSRMMWRTNGAGELYLYVPQAAQDPGICQVPPRTECNDAYGISEGRGAFNFTAGGWTTIEQTITLGSSATSKNGKFSIKVNDKSTSISFDKVMYPAGFQGIMFSTFFGGHGPQWASPTSQQAYFKDFSVAVIK